MKYAWRRPGYLSRYFSARGWSGLYEAQPVQSRYSPPPVPSPPHYRDRSESVSNGLVNRLYEASIEILGSVSSRWSFVRPRYSLRGGKYFICRN